MLIPFGKFKGEPVEALPTQYLVWLLSRDNVRYKRWEFAREALRVLRDRLVKNLPTIEAELIVSDEAALVWVAKRAAAKKQSRLEKREQLEAKRAAERQRLRDDTRRWIAEHRGVQAPRVQPPQAQSQEVIAPRVPPPRRAKHKPPPPPKAIFRQPGRWVDKKFGWVIRLTATDGSDLV